MECLYHIIADFQKTNIFDEVYYFYEKIIFFLAKRFGIQEYQSDLFYDLWIITKNINLEELSSNKDLSCYIYKSLKNYAINYYKKKKNDNNKVIYNSEIASDEIDKTTTCPFDDSLLIFKDITNHLSSKKQVNIINLRYLKGLSDMEIADKLHISRQAVYKSRLCALNNLKQCI